MLSAYDEPCSRFTAARDRLFADGADAARRAEGAGDEEQRIAGQEESDEQSRLGEHDRGEDEESALLDPLVGEVQQSQHGVTLPVGTTKARAGARAFDRFEERCGQAAAPAMLLLLRPLNTTAPMSTTSAAAATL